MARSNNILDKIQTPISCSVGWDAMVGDDHARHCKACEKSVYNLSNMTRREAEALILKSNGKLCAQYLRCADGSVVTRFDPSGREKLGGSHLRLAAGALTAIISLTSTSMVQAGQAGQGQKSAKVEAIDKKPAEKPDILPAGISGTVHDSQGVLVTGAMISIFSTAGIQIKNSTSNEIGVFELGPLSAGAYVVKVDAGKISQFAPDKLIIPTEGQKPTIQIVLGTDGFVMSQEILGEVSPLLVVTGITEIALPPSTPKRESWLMQLLRLIP